MCDYGQLVPVASAAAYATDQVPQLERRISEPLILR